MTKSVDLTYSLGAVYASEWSEQVREILFAPAPADGELSLEQGFELLDSGVDSAPENLIPLCVVDEASIAVVVSDGPAVGTVCRWFLDPVAPEHQAGILDLHPLLYVAGLDRELKARQRGLDRILDEVGPAYSNSHLKNDKRPRTFVVRPIRVACQNVIVALAAIAQDASIDGLAVLAWQTCEVPHVATHEANRALAVITLCDAFQNGGTMEIRFDRPAGLTHEGKRLKYTGHPEAGVPASLRRFARTVGVDLGVEDEASISPVEARDLFRAVTPMPAELRERVDSAIAAGGIKPERLYFTLLKPIWRDIELDWLLEVSSRVASILEGGASWEQRSARQAEAEACRTALVAGMFFRRLNGTDAAAAEEDARVVEDRARGVEWSVDGESATIAFTGVAQDEPLPWAVGRRVVPGGRRVVVGFRAQITPDSVAAILAAAGEDVAVLAVPRGTAVPPDLPEDVVVAHCPDRLADLDKAVEANLTSSRISRA
jgi:hypothetical protein